MVTLHLEDPQEQHELAAAPYHTWTLPDGCVWTEFRRSGDGYHLRFPGYADYTIDATGREVHAWPVPGAAEATVLHLHHNQVLPLALSRQRRLVLHASAVELPATAGADAGAVAFLGASGLGKSTLAASFAMSGCRFLTDDGLQLDERDGRIEVIPAHPSIRLWDDSREALLPEDARLAPAVDYTPKARILAAGSVAHCPERRPLLRAYVLGPGAAARVTLEPITPRDALVELVKHSFLLDVEERDMLAWHFEALSSLAARSLCFRLDYPRRYDTLAAVRATVATHATSP